MAPSSIHMIVECHQRGLLSKEAAAKLAIEREQLVKAAMRRQAGKLVESIEAAEGETKEAGVMDFLGRRGAEAAKPAGNFLGKLKSGWGDIGSNVAKMMAVAGLTAGATAGVGAVMRHSRDKKLKDRIADSYTQMFDEVPELKEMRDDPVHRRAIERNFGVIAEFAPSLAAIPIVAGTFVRSQSVKSQMDTGTISALAKAQRDVDEMHETRHGGSGPKMAPFAPHQLATSAMRGGGKSGE